MPGKRRSKSQLDRDRRQIASLYLRGWLQVDIAEKLGISQQTVSLDLKALHREWQRSAIADIDKAKARELAKIDNLEREYWVAWRRSRKDAETITEKNRGEAEDGKLIDPQRMFRRKGQAGDPRFLQGIQWCIERRCKILGIDAPDRHDITSGGVTLGRLFEEALKRAYGDDDDGDGGDAGHEGQAEAAAEA